jgi:rare lipoprotein A (peptidoglycan hydrolase)
MTVLAVPILALDNIPRHDAQAEQITQTGAGLGGSVSSAIAAQRASQAAPAPAAQALAAPAPATVPPSTAPATTAPRPTAPPTSAAPVTRPPTTAPAPTAPPPTAPPLPPNTQEGSASWYRQPSHWPENGCAHTTLPFGTLVTVTNLSTGASTTCVVNDRGPFVQGRVIDLDDDVFARLAPLPQGLIPVRITW